MKLEPKFCAGSKPACSVPEVCADSNLYGQAGNMAHFH